MKVTGLAPLTPVLKSSAHLIPGMMAAAVVVNPSPITLVMVVLGGVCPWEVKTLGSP